MSALDDLTARMREEGYEKVTCQECKGVGRVPCKTCHGEGYFSCVQGCHDRDCPNDCDDGEHGCGDCDGCGMVWGRP